MESVFSRSEREKEVEPSLSVAWRIVPLTDRTKRNSEALPNVAHGRKGSITHTALMAKLKELADAEPDKCFAIEWWHVPNQLWIRFVWRGLQEPENNWAREQLAIKRQREAEQKKNKKKR